MRLLPWIALPVFAPFLTAQMPDSIATTPSPHVVKESWDASWIGPSSSPSRDYGIYHFRRSFELDAKPERFVVNLSADNRYRLFVNGTPVHIGPARGDLEHWRFDTLDIARFLNKGRNVVAVKVWNFGEYAPMAQPSSQTAFILQGDSQAEAILNTDNRWRVMSNDAYSPISGFRELMRVYHVVGPGDDVNASRYPWGWEQPDFDDSDWKSAASIEPGKPIGADEDAAWGLTPRQIPLLAASQTRFAAVRRSEGIEPPSGFLSGEAALEIPANTHATLLLDQEELTTAYPELRVSGGAGSEIKVTYAEALFEAREGPKRKEKGHRDMVESKYMRGNHDLFRPDGGDARVFRPLRWRTYRYVQLDISTGEQPLTIDDYSAEFIVYPFQERGRFEAQAPDLRKIWDISWRTLRLGTHEIFTDCPYYEQLCYVGDTRIQALIAMYVSGGDKLVRKTIEAFDNSRQPNGLTRSRWPDRELQIIPPYSLFWVTMVHDYWRLRDDPEFVEQRLAGIQEVLNYFREHSDPETGSYHAEEWWNFVDWISAWGRDPISNHGGVPPRDENGASAILDLHLVYTLQQAGELFRAFGKAEQAHEYDAWAERLRQHVIESCWDENRKLVADTTKKDSFSQHAQSLFILTAGDKAPELRDLAERMLSDESLTQATFYFAFYPHQAMVEAGLGNQYLEQLGPWRELIQFGLTTVPETSGNDTRSDSHAWGSHPILGMLETICGIESAEPGFKSVRIRPHLNGLPLVQGAVVHPQGMIEVNLRPKAQNGLTGSITLPQGVPGTLEWQGQTIQLKPGPNQIDL